MNCERCRKKKTRGNTKLCPSCTITVFRQRRKMRLVEYKGGKCEVCEYNGCVDAFDFHHKDPSTKSFNLSKNGNCRSLKRDKEEVDKCLLMCSNCHRELHADMKLEYDKDLSNRKSLVQ